MSRQVTLIKKFISKSLPLGVQLERGRNASLAADIVSRARSFGAEVKVTPEQVHSAFDRLVLWKQLDTAFEKKEAFAGRDALLMALTGQITIGNAFYKTGDIRPVDEMKPAMTQFLLRCFGHEPWDTYKYSFEHYYVPGPVAELHIADGSNPLLSRAVFPGLTVPEKDILFIWPVDDDLTGVHFDVLNRQGSLVKRFAHDGEAPELFSEYDYADEELRQFRLLNAELFSLAGQRLFDAIRQYASAWQKASLSRRSFDAPVPEIDIQICGPARSIEILVDSVDLEEKKHEPKWKVTIPYLNLEKALVHRVKTYKASMPDLNYPTFVIEISTGRPDERNRKYYFDWTRGTFIIVAQGKLDAKNRAVVPDRIRRTAAGAQSSENKLVF